MVNNIFPVSALIFSLLLFSCGVTDPNSDDSQMALIPSKGKSFIMGDTGSTAALKFPHKVSFSYDFYMDKYEVTQGEYQNIMGDNPSFYHGSTRLPVEAMEWWQAVQFCNLKSRKMGLDPVYTPLGFFKYLTDYTKNGFRLPTEAEWEFACRAGSEGYYYGNIALGNINEITKYEWIEYNSSDQTHEVGVKKPNPFGLYDMLGNVSEWCNDYYDTAYYKDSPEFDPRGPDSGTQHVNRGGNNKTLFTGCATRNPPCGLWSSLGFRCVRRKM